MIGAGVMIVGGIVAVLLAVGRGGQLLEEVAAPLSAVTSRRRVTG